MWVGTTDKVCVPKHECRKPINKCNQIYCEYKNLFLHYKFYQTFFYLTKFIIERQKKSIVERISKYLVWNDRYFVGQQTWNNKSSNSSLTKLYNFHCSTSFCSRRTRLPWVYILALLLVFFFFLCFRTYSFIRPGIPISGKSLTRYLTFFRIC